jgi:hypothetical protein
MSLTVPQIIMLNHAADVNWKRSEERSAAKKEQKAKEDDNPIVFAGKRADELDSDEFALYLGASVHSAEGMTMTVREF